MNPHYLFPSVIVCSCGKRFESSAHESNYGDERWSAPKSPTSALWLFLRHRAARLLNQCGPKKPHCADSVMIRCVFCQKSIDINRYGEHLHSEQCTPETSLRRASNIYKCGRQSAVLTTTPTFECYRCLDDDRFRQLDAAALVEHRAHSSNYEMYIACAECQCKVPLCDAVGHAAFVHADRLANRVSVADMFCTAPPPGSTVESSSTEDVIVGSGPLYNSGLDIGQAMKPDPDSTGPDSDLLATFSFDIAPPEQADIDDDDDAEIDDAEQPSQWWHLLECHVCGSTFHTKSELWKHTRLHARARPHQCKGCGASYNIRRYLLIHWRSGLCGTKPPEPSWPCEQCAKVFPTKGLLDVHRRSHTGERPFACTRCDVRTATKALLLGHMANEHSIGKYRCDKCALVFPWKSGLAMHQRSHTGERPFQCEHCDFSTSTKALLQRHMANIHSIGKYPCNQCSRVFAGKGKLRMHRTIHTGERPYECSKCDLTFRVRTVQRQHEMTHDQVKNFHCQPCGKSFLLAKNLQQHCKMQVHAQSVAAAAAALAAAQGAEHQQQVAAWNGSIT